MGIPVNSLKVTFSGVSGGPEVWQTSFWIAGADLSTVSDANLAIAVASAPWTNLFNALKLIMNTSTQITAVDEYGYAGGTAASVHAHATVAVLGTGASAHPNQCALVTTLRTATPGRSGRGRMYWPANGILHSAASGLYSPAPCDGVTDALSALFTSQNLAGPKVSVISQMHTSAAAVLSVDNDYVPDTQRRRSNKLHSLRHSHVV